MKLRCLLGGPIALWVVMVGAGFAALMNYETTPGDQRPTPISWSKEMPKKSSDLFTLVIFLHPRCPCSRATVAELAEIFRQSGERLELRIFFFKPESMADEWAQTGLWRAAVAIPGSTVASDTAGTEAAKFGAITSGHAFLYGKDGHLRFEGGLTDGRGQYGPGKGRAVILDALAISRDAVSHAPVYGCSLLDPACFCGAANVNSSPIHAPYDHF